MWRQLERPRSSAKLQTNLCVSSSCESTSEVICRHCSQQYCQLCFMCHRKNILDDMRSISEQMSTNRCQGVSEVIAFIDKQAKDAHDSAKKLVDDAIDRIVQASKNIYAYIENRRQAKLGRLDECLEKFDKDATILNAKLQNKIFLSADTILDIRRKYAYNMFDTMTSIIENQQTELQRKTEAFFNDYRYYNELINLRQKWTFLQAALTTVYYPTKKDISLDKILTFLEYRHDRVLQNYQDFLSTNEDSKVLELSSQSPEDLLNNLSFLSKRKLRTESDNFSYISESVNADDSDKCVSSKQHGEKTEIKQEIEITSKADSGQDEDLSSDSSVDNWAITDGDEDEFDYDTRFMNLSQTMKTLQKQFEDDFEPFTNQKE